MTLYKVLKDGKSAHGGDYAWSLPTEAADGTWAPGDWSPPVRDPRICHRGYHLTDDPMRWPLVGMTVYDAEGDGEDPQDDQAGKRVFTRARLLRPSAYEIPAYWRAVEEFAASIPAIPWLTPDGEPDPDWVLVERGDWPAAGDAARGAAWDAAWDAAGDAAWDAARGVVWDAVWGAVWGAVWDAAGDAAWDAAWDAVLMAAIRVCNGLPVAPEHVAHAEARWTVWRKGYALLCDVDGALVVYAAPGDGGAPTP